MDPLTTLKEQEEKLNVLSDELTHLYGGRLSFPDSPVDRPFTVVNFVTTIGGLTSFVIPGKAGGGHISNFNAQDTFVMGLLRTLADGVAVGANTLRSEPEHLWTADFISPDHASLFQDLRNKLDKTRPHPMSIFFTASGKVLPQNASDPTPTVFTHPDIETLIVTTTEGDAKVRQDFGLRKLVPTTLIAEEKDHLHEVSMRVAMRELRRNYGIDFLLVEGGATFNGAVVNAELYDEIFLTGAPQVIGTSKEQPRPIFAQGFNRFPENAIWHELVSLKVHGDYVFTRYRRK